MRTRGLRDQPESIVDGIVANELTCGRLLSISRDGILNLNRMPRDELSMSALIGNQVQDEMLPGLLRDGLERLAYVPCDEQIRQLSAHTAQAVGGKVQACTFLMGTLSPQSPNSTLRWPPPPRLMQVIERRQAVDFPNRNAPKVRLLMVRLRYETVDHRPNGWPGGS